MALLIRHGLAAILVWVSSSVISAHAAGDVQPVEQKIKVGLLYNFVRYTTWPDSRLGGSMEICLFGADPFEGALQPLEERTVNQHTIVIRTVRSAPDTAACHLLFISADQQGQWPALRSFLADKSVLTVSDFSGFAEAGGMIEFTRVSDRVGAKLNLDTVMAARLTVEDRLLNLVSVMRSNAGGTP